MPQGNTILHILALQKDKELARDMYEFMTSWRAEEDIEMMANNDGFTPLQLIAYEGNYEVLTSV